MDLMSKGTLALFLALSIAAFIAVIVLWKRLSKTSFLTITLRISSLIMVNVLFIATLGLLVNNYGGFYGSWSELFGLEKVVTSVPEEQVLSISKADLAKATITADGGALIREVIKGTNSHVTGTILTLLPASYVHMVESNADSKAFRIFHVIQFLSGFPGYPTTWIHGMNMVGNFEKAQLTGAMPPTVAVLPQINILPHRDTECLDVPAGPQIETWLTKDVVSYEKKFLNLRDERWGVTGYSTGGWCSAMLSLRNPDVYMAAAPIAGYFEPQFATTFPAESLAEMKAKYDIKAIASSNPPAIKMLFINSLRDASTNKETKDFYSLLQPPVEKSQIILVHSGHNLRAWSKIEPQLFQWFGKALKEERIAQAAKASKS